MAGDTTVDILRRMIESDPEDYPPEAARWVLRFRFTDTDHARVSDLAARSTAGTLTAAERREYECYVHADNVLSLLKAKARRSLRERSPAA